MPREFAKLTSADDKAFAIRNAVDTLIEAQRIKNDKALMKAVRPELKKMAQAAQTAAAKTT